MAEESPTIPPVPAVDAAASSGDRGLADLAAEHLRQTPAPNPEAVAAEKKKLAAELDPAIYRFDESGNPIFNKDGTPARRRGPKPAQIAAAEENRQLQYQALGLATAETFFVLCVSLGGDGWKPEDPEREQLAHAWGVYYASTGLTALPPWAVVLCATATYAGRRLQLPETQNRLVRMYLWAKGKLFR